MANLDIISAEARGLVSIGSSDISRSLTVLDFGRLGSLVAVAVCS